MSCCCSHLLLPQRKNQHLDLESESDGRCVGSRHESASGCEESTNVDGALPGCVIVAEETVCARAGWGECQLPSELEAAVVFEIYRGREGVQ
jgi:hypothetical protein